MEMPLGCPRGHTGRFEAIPASGGGWTVTVEVDDHIVSIKHCTDWLRVERFRVRVEAQVCSEFASRAELEGA